VVLEKLNEVTDHVKKITAIFDALKLNAVEDALR